MSVESIGKRNVTNFEYPILGKASDLTLSKEFHGVEKWFSAQSHYDGNYTKPYEHSYTDGFAYLNEGLSCYTMAYAYVDRKVTCWVPASFERYGCRAVPVWPTYYKGHYLYYTDPYWSWRWYDSKISGVQEISSSFSDLGDRGTYPANSWQAYLGCNSRSYWYNGYNWVSALTPVRRAYYISREYTYYKKYFMHSEPFIHWKIQRVRYNFQQSPCGELYSGTSGWIGGFLNTAKRFIFGVSDDIAWSWYYPQGPDRNDEFRLLFPDSPISESKFFYTQRPDYHDSAGWATHTADEERIKKSMIDITGIGNPKIIFLEGNYSYSDRVRNGPRNIFRCPVRYKSFNYTAFDRKVYKCGCHYEVYHTPRVESDHYISVDLNSYDCLFSNVSTDTPRFSNNIIANDYMDFISASTVYPGSSAGKCYNVDLNGREHWIGYPPQYIRNDNVGFGSMENEGPWGWEGWGMLGFIPGLNTEIIDNPPFEQYNQYLQIQDWNKFDVRLRDLQFNYCTVIGDGGHQVYWDGKWWTCPKGKTPQVIVQSFDEGLRRAWINACTFGTFFPDEELSLSNPKVSDRYITPREEAGKYYYNTPFDVSVRVLYNQLINQRSYFDIAEQLFCGHTDGVIDGDKPTSAPYVIDFDAMKLIIDGPSGNGDGMISKKVWKLSKDPEAIVEASGKAHPAKSVYGFNQWISVAREWFCNSPAENAANRRQLRQMILNRKNSYDKIIEELKEFAPKTSPELSYRDYTRIKEIISEVNETITKNTGMDEFFYAYLNVLYEYRRYFINKRCNKEDGTLFQMRAIESMLPMIINAQNVQAPAEVEDFGDPSLKVAFYAVQNTIKDKVQSAINYDPLDRDRVKTVYIKVDYVTEKEYLESCQKLKDRIISEPEVVKVRYTYHPKNPDGTYQKNPDGSYKTLPGKGFKYAKKPKNGPYRLESTEFLDNLAKVNYNNTVTDGSHKEVNPLIDEAWWYIDWGVTKPEPGCEKEVGETDILFDVFAFVDISRAIDVVKDGITNPQDILCGSKIAQDYWIVHVESALPRIDGYKTDVKLTPYNSEGGTKAAVEQNLLGAQTAILFPITEEQEYSEVSLGDISKLISTDTSRKS